MEERNTLNDLYGENLKLGNKINSLNDENNFFRIQINNFNKLTNSINKDLYKLGINFQNKDIIEESMKVGPLFIISNKIKLKNLQLKIGNSIRYTEKFKKNLDGSIPYISKEIEKLEGEVSILLTNYMQMKQENELLKDINYGEVLSDFYDEYKDEGGYDFYDSEVSMAELENKKKEELKKLEFVKKDHKEKNRTLCELLSHNEALEDEVSKLKMAMPKNKEESKMRAAEARELEKLQNEEKKLMSDIVTKSKELEAQYEINKDCKQKIVDKKYQENKEIKVLEDEVLKCREQVREFKQKISKAESKRLRNIENIME